MRLLFTPVGSHGDIHPSIALAQALQARGHDAIIVTNSYFQKVIEDAGVPFRAIGQHVDLAKAAQTPGAMSGHAGPIKLMRRLVLPEIAPATTQFIEMLRELKPDGVVAHPLALAAPIACEKVGVPWAGTALAPVSWWNWRDQPVMSPWQHATPPQFQARVVQWAGRQLMRLLIDGEVRQVRGSLGLTKQRDHFHRLCVGGVVNLGLWSPVYREATEGDPSQGVITGFPWFDVVKAHDHQMDELDRFLDEGDAPLLFSLGTAAVHVAGRFYSEAARACALLGRRGLLLVGKKAYAPAQLPRGVRAFEYAPYSRVFPRCSAIVHHGGIGTTAQALRSGVAQLVTPMAHDQFDNAARVKRLGVGLRLGHARVTTLRLVQRLKHLLEDPTFAQRAKDIGPCVGRENGAVRACEALELAFGQRPAR